MDNRDSGNGQENSQDLKKSSFCRSLDNWHLLKPLFTLSALEKSTGGPHVWLKLDWNLKTTFDKGLLLKIIYLPFICLTRLTSFWLSVYIQARAYAKVMKATLFFSSATHNINVNKIFKFIMAKLFNLPWTVERNLTAGEPIIDF